MKIEFYEINCKWQYFIGDCIQRDWLTCKQSFD